MACYHLYGWSLGGALPVAGAPGVDMLAGSPSFCLQWCHPEAHQVLQSPGRRGQRAEDPPPCTFGPFGLGAL
jgi:hypothetical protein